MEWHAKLAAIDILAYLNDKLSLQHILRTIPYSELESIFAYIEQRVAKATLEHEQDLQRDILE